MWCTTGSVLGPLLFLKYINNDLHKAIQYYKVHRFDDDTSIFDTIKSVKNVKKKNCHKMQNCINPYQTK